ncbi:MAG: hypothetical protein ACXAEX_09930 [Promethearchaeota archaeon]
MKLKLIIKPKRKKNLIAWIEKNKDFDDSTQQILRFFKDDIRISKFSKILRYNIVSSENPGIILSLFSAIQELIPDIYFNSDEPIELEDPVTS